jgi:hypothetical protein
MDASAYGKVLIGDPVVEFSKNWKPGEGGYEIVIAAGDDTLEITPNIAELYINAPECPERRSLADLHYGSRDFRGRPVVMPLAPISAMSVQVLFPRNHRHLGHTLERLKKTKCIIISIS